MSTKNKLFPSGLIVSCQSEGNSLFNNENSILSFSKEVEKGGASALRLREPNNIKLVRKNTLLPIIGLTKSYYSNTKMVLITPSYKDVIDLKNAGADYIAFDATGRNGFSHILKTKELEVGIIGDISDISQAELALKNGCDILTTALSGYTKEKIMNPFEQPDFKLLKALIQNFNCPILAEGRYWNLDQVNKAFDMGASAVVIGSAITRPALITKYFHQTIKEI